MKKRILTNITLIIFGLFIFFILLETTLTLGLVDRNHKWCQGPEDRRQFHPEYGWNEYPDQNYLERKDGKWSWHTHNSEGFRSTHDSGSQNVIVLGDSFTRGSLADDNSTYPYLIDEWSPDTTFLNYGIGGYDTRQELVVYRNISNKYEHDVVILGYYMGNDMKENVASGPLRPKFVVENGTVVRERGSTPISAEVFHKFKNFMNRNTKSSVYIGEKIYETLGGQKTTSKPPSGEELAEQRRLTRLLVSEIATEAGQHDAELLILGIPSRGDVDPERPVSYRPEDAQEYWQTQRNMLRNVSKNGSNIHYLDLKPHLVDELENGTRVYGHRDAHLNEQGYWITARSVHTWLVDNGKIQSNSSVSISRNDDNERTTCPN